jgi:hypothetical protein
MKITISDCNTEKPMVRIITENADYLFDIGIDNLQGKAAHGLSLWGGEGEIEEISYNSETNRVQIYSFVYNPKDEKKSLKTTFNESQFLQEYKDYEPAPNKIKNWIDDDHDMPQ